MVEPDLHCFAARLSILPELLAHVRARCRDAGIDEPATLRIELVLEEIFTNTVRHGYRGDSDAPVWLGAARVSDALLLTYQDAAPPHDPLAQSIHVPATLEERGVGGLGILLARQLASAIAYRRSGDRNVLTLTFRRPA